MIYFINIRYFEKSLFSWKLKNFQKSFFLESSLTRKAPQGSRYYHINKEDLKIAYIKKNDIVFIIGADKFLQFQILEVILDAISDKFIELYGETFLNTYDAIYDDFFKGFNSVVENSIKTAPNKNGKFVNAYCKLCNETLRVYIKNSLIESAEKKLVPLVFNHQDHALLLYIDTNFKVRGTEIVSISG